LKVGKGSNVTTLVTGSTEYVPSPVTVRVVFVQLGGVSAVTGGVADALASPHNFTVVATSGALTAPGASFVNRLIVWFVS
jgi:hypothetical protein